MAKTKTDKAAERESKYFVEEYTLRDVQLLSKVSTGSQRRSMSLRALFTNITLIEDLFSNVAKIQISLVDAEGFMESFPVIGDEIIEISLEHPLTTTNIDETIHKQRFHLYDMQMIPSERKLAEFTLYGVSEEYVKSMQLRISKRYTGLNSDSVKDIVRTYFGNKKSIKVEKTKTTQTTIIPNWTPFEAINYFASRSMTSNDEELELLEGGFDMELPTGSFYVFYEKLNEGFRFESIESLILNQRNKDMVKYIYTPRSVEGATLDTDQGMHGVDTIRVIGSFDAMRNLGRGMYASRLIAYDPIRMKYEIIKYDYFEDPTSKTDENNRYHDFVTMDGNSTQEKKMISVHSDMLGEYTSMTKLATTTKDHDTLFVPPYGEVGAYEKKITSTPIGVSDTTFKDRGAKSNNVENWLLQRNAQEQEFDNLRLKISVAGNSSRHVGDLINFDFPTYMPVDDIGNSSHQLYSGRYMVTKIEHIITQTRYTMDMEIVKNSFTKDLPGNNEGYKRLEVIQEGLDEMGRQGGKAGSRAIRNPDGSIRIAGGL